RRAAAAREKGNPVRPRELERRLHVRGVARHDDADRLHLVHRRVGGVEQARGSVEADVAPDDLAKLALWVGHASAYSWGRRRWATRRLQARGLRRRRLTWPVLAPAMWRENLRDGHDRVLGAGADRVEQGLVDVVGERAPTRRAQERQVGVQIGIADVAIRELQ